MVFSLRGQPEGRVEPSGGGGRGWGRCGGAQSYPRACPPARQTSAGSRSAGEAGSHGARVEREVPVTRTQQR